MQPLGGDSQVVQTSPTAGTRVHRGAIVTFVLRCCGPVGSPGISTKPLPATLVPNFVGGLATAAYAWTARHNLYFNARLSPLIAGDAPVLLDNYRVVRQDPAPEHPLEQGIGANTSRTSGYFIVTPPDPPLSFDDGPGP